MTLSIAHILYTLTQYFMYLKVSTNLIACKNGIVSCCVRESLCSISRWCKRFGCFCFTRPARGRANIPYLCFNLAFVVWPRFCVVSDTRSHRFAHPRDFLSLASSKGLRFLHARVMHTNQRYSLILSTWCRLSCAPVDTFMRLASSQHVWACPSSCVWYSQRFVARNDKYNL